ncbi:MAG: agmatinase [Bacteroidales bacterium]|nr:agmatinase [Bacteroidales bacterium]MDZ4204087.1 agmatinase [Bacteroidales bacterium]
MNFGDLPEKYCSPESSKVVILPVPYDETSTWIKGADKGPEAIIEASANMEVYDIDTDSEAYLMGIYTAEPVTENSSPEAMVKAVRDRVKQYLKKNKFVVTLGGEHTIAIGSIQAHAAHYEDLTVVQIDAHADLRDEYMGSKNNHACVMARIKEIAPIIQIGIRSMSVEETENIKAGSIYYAHEIMDGKIWMYEMLSQLGKNVYITFDLDAFDPSIMPSTGTPEPGGLLWYQTIEMVQRIFEKSNVVGFDVNELCPNHYNKAPDFLAARLIYKMLAFKFGEQVAKKKK